MSGNDVGTDVEWEKQAGVAMLLGTLVALTLWILYLLVTWPSTCATLQQQREEKEEQKRESQRDNKVKNTMSQEGKKTK